MNFSLSNLGKWLAETDKKLNILCEISNSFISRDTFSFFLNETFQIKSNNIIIHKIKTNLIYSGISIVQLLVNNIEYDIFYHLSNKEYIDIIIDKRISNVKNKDLTITLKDSNGVKLDLIGLVYIRTI